MLERRQKYLKSKGIHEVEHHMNNEQKEEFCKPERAVFQMSVDQKKRQAADRDTFNKGLPQKAGEKKTERIKILEPAKTKAVVSAPAADLRRESALGGHCIHWPL